MRVSDNERQRTIAELGRHLAAGRLDADDYARRVEAAALAVDLVDLDAIVADLPMLRIAGPDARRPQPPRRVASRGRWRAWVVVAGAAAVLIVGIVLAFAAQWLTFGVLLAAWLVGVVQARAAGPRR